MDNNRQGTTIDNNPQCYMHLWQRFELHSIVFLFNITSIQVFRLESGHVFSGRVKYCKQSIVTKPPDAATARPTFHLQTTMRSVQSIHCFNPASQICKRLEIISPLTICCSVIATVHKSQESGSNLSSELSKKSLNSHLLLGARKIKERRRSQKFTRDHPHPTFSQLTPVGTSTTWQLIHQGTWWARKYNL